GEYESGPGGAGRIHIFNTPGGSDTATPSPSAPSGLWATQADLMPYDITLLTCEGEETRQMNQQALYDYAQGGGRVFASHYHYAWFNTGPFAAQNLATWRTGTQAYGGNNGTIDAIIQTTLPSGGPFPKGIAMKQWLGNVNALQPSGELEIQQARHNAKVTAANTTSTPWIVSDSAAQPPGETEYFSFDTPFGAGPSEQCGRVVYSDLHVGAASMDYGGYGNGGTIPPGAVVPSGCTMGQLSDQEKALEFMLFDLSACIQNESDNPTPPPPR
ncbi:MAG: hypothetical protein ACREJX_09355, partial [Polyangiaceae bacterium]